MTTLDVMEWLRERTERRIADYREYLAEHPVPHYMTTEEHDKVTTVIEILEDILEEIESADRALRPWMQPGEPVDFHFDMGSDEVTNPGLRVLGEVRDHCGSLCVRVTKEGLVCVRALTQAGGECLKEGLPDADPPLMSCPECGTLLEVHRDSGRIVCPHCRYEEGSS